ncbi:condensation domain-containing protein, partial [Nocardia cyriacigeorgica]|uniref:condensation domain-containing protein n=1 Tax=Nocardia cyriacigeorgica TaxID=135487 RepID=UPI002454FE1C
MEVSPSRGGGPTPPPPPPRPPPRPPPPPPAGMSAVVSYATDLFDESTVDEFTRRYLRVLETVVAEPATAVREIDILDDAERATVLSGWNDTTHEVPAATVLELFAEQVRQRPVELAVVFDAAGRIDGLDEELTYA